MRDYIELTKPRITCLILLSTALGFRFGSALGWNWTSLLSLIAGTALLSSGASTLNQWYERSSDGLMNRTAQRPIPSGRICANNALAFGLWLLAFGLLELAILNNLFTALLGLLTAATYLLIYTPLKRRTKWAMAIGALPGAMPPLLGYAAARNSLGPIAFVLFGILFLWQFPHFLAIASMYRDDYSRASIRVLPVVEPDGASTQQQMRLTVILLLAISLAPTMLGATSVSYAAAAFALGVGFSYAVWVSTSRQILLASVTYLPMLYGFLLLGAR